jgi:hypothetical protein
MRQALGSDRSAGWYYYSDRVIGSTWSLGELLLAARGPSDEPAIAISLLDTAPLEPAETNWIHHWPPECGRLSLALTDDRESFLLRFGGLADFIISKNGSRIEAWPAPATGWETLRHLLLDQVLPRVLAQQGQLVLHAGAVRIGDQAIAFIGSSGSGKSTLTASFHAAGYPVLCDDGVVLTQSEDVTLVMATYSSLRLWPESITRVYPQTPATAAMAHYSSKRRIILGDTAANAQVSLPLASLYLIGSEVRPDDAEISLLSPRDGCITMIGNSFQLDVTDDLRAADIFAVASRIAEQVPMYSLSYPRDFALLPELREAILRQHSRLVSLKAMHETVPVC